jgi:hypothetical protein
MGWLQAGIRCWWSDLLETQCGHCLGQCTTTGEVIE